ncbi:putative Adiponectin receptor protein 2 [Cardiosporidium cionae]|uniref:Adiponectin receptor protein 2 n=1 Tax=Cardiosporidium cionae TaxID=476202 RepID=A0ABQ7J8S4_9APIC|nr:putative Adiponectin receptor protein 2 [Cardiosporidium cionae]|eukprot:KAF8820368.1 putative Adiponectin receptor protein 2 [Cardiosporidium cionae]
MGHAELGQLPEPNFEQSQICNAVPICDTSSNIGTVNDVPLYQKIPFILGGYRLKQTNWKICLASILKLHNETCNIWTHLVGFVYFMAYAIHFVWLNGDSAMRSFKNSILLFIQEAVNQGNIPFSSVDKYDILFEDKSFFVLLGLILTSALCMFGSVVFHVFCSSSPRSQKNCLKLDITGINGLICWSAFAGIHIGFYCTPLFHKLYMIQTIILACVLIPAPFLGEFLSPKIWNFYPVFCALLALTGFIPLLHYFSLASTNEIKSFGVQLAAMPVLYLAGLFFYLTRIPEKIFPGKFDIVGHSHQIWHVFVFFAACCWVHGCRNAYLHRFSSNIPCSE